jgi:flagellar hook-length control protein FliK
MSFKEVLPGEGSIVRLQKEGPEAASIQTAKNALSLPEPLPKVLDKMMWMAQSGEQKGTIQISPPELGRLDLDLVIRQGHLQAHLSAENSQVKEIIEANMGQLKQQLTDLGLVVDRFDVMVGLEDRSLAREQGRAAGQGKGRTGGRQAPGKPVAAVESNMRRDPVRGSSQIDMRV